MTAILVRRWESQFPVKLFDFWNEFNVNEICCMEWPQTTLTLQVRETSSCTNINVRESAAEFLLAPDNMKLDQGFLKHAIPWFVGVGVWYWTKCNSTHGPSRVLGKSLECTSHLCNKSLNKGTTTELCLTLRSEHFQPILQSLITDCYITSQHILLHIYSWWYYH